MKIGIHEILICVRRKYSVHSREIKAATHRDKRRQFHDR